MLEVTAAAASSGCRNWSKPGLLGSGQVQAVQVWHARRDPSVKKGESESESVECNVGECGIC